MINKRLQLIFRIQFYLFVLTTYSCADINEMQNSLNDIESRISQMESKTDLLNKNIEAIQLLSNATTIHNVTYDNNATYKITLTNGKELILTTGNAGIGNVPIVSIDKDGFWIVDYLDGNGPVNLLSNGNKIPSVGKDAVTPTLGIDNSGFLTIDYGAGPVNIKDDNGNSVKATSATTASDPFFSDIVFDEAKGILTVTLKAGNKQIVLPVVPDFLFSISNSDGMQIFEVGESKVYPLSSSGVKNAVVQAPEGWRVLIEETSVSITAPPSTKGILIADSDADIVFLAQAVNGGHISVSKIKVSLSGVTINVKPELSISQGEIGANSLTFNFLLQDATAYKYILRKSIEDAPTIDEVKSNGTKATDLTLTISGLSARTNYTIYVLASNGDIYGESLDSISAKTAMPTYSSYYAAYEAGAEIPIGNITISKALNGEATLLTEATKIISTDGIYFVPENIIATYNSGTLNNIIIIGDNPSKKSDFTPTAQRITFNPNGPGNFVLFNIHYYISTPTGQGQIMFYPKSEAGGMIEYVAFEDCYLDMSGLQGMSFSAPASESAPIGIDDLSIYNCNINVGADTRFNYFFQYRKYGEIKKAALKNNIIWSSSEVNTTRIFNMSTGTSAEQYATACPLGSLEFTNNTWINCKPTAINVVKKIDNLIINNNIFLATLSGYTPFILFDESNYSITSGEVGNNITYNRGTGKYCWKAVNANKLFGKSSAFKLLTENPFDGGTFDTSAGVFVPSSSYYSYGAQR